MNLRGELDYMQMCAETFPVSAWKVYPYDEPWLANESLGAPFIDKAGQVIDRDGDAVGGNGPPTRAGNFLDDLDLAGYHLVEGRAPQGDFEVVMDKGTAEKAHLNIGDTAIVRLPEVLEVTLVGLVKYGPEAQYDSISGSTWFVNVSAKTTGAISPDPAALEPSRARRVRRVQTGGVRRRSRPTIASARRLVSAADDRRFTIGASRLPQPASSSTYPNARALSGVPCSRQ